MSVNVSGMQDLRGRTIATPLGSTSHYQLMYFLRCAFARTHAPAQMHMHIHAPACTCRLINMTEDVTVRTALPSEHVKLWQNGEIDGVCVIAH